MGKYRKRLERKEKNFVRGSIATVVVASLAIAFVQANKANVSVWELLTGSSLSTRAQNYDTHKRIKELSENQLSYAASMSNEIVNSYMKDYGVSKNWHLVFVNNLPYVVDLSTSIMLDHDFQTNENNQMHYHAKIYKLNNMNAKKIDQLHDLWECLESLRNYNSGNKFVSASKARSSLEELIKILEVEPRTFFNFTVTKDVDDEFIASSKESAKENLNPLFEKIVFLKESEKTIGLPSTGTREEHALLHIIHNDFASAKTSQTSEQQN